MDANSLRAGSSAYARQSWRRATAVAYTAGKWTAQEAGVEGSMSWVADVTTVTDFVRVQARERPDALVHKLLGQSGSFRDHQQVAHYGSVAADRVGNRRHADRRAVRRAPCG
jgi:hypothetical protein